MADRRACPDAVREELYRVFPNIYFTIMSVVQGVALSILALRIFESFDNGALNFYFLVYAALSFGGMVVVLFEYSYYVALVRRPPMITDIYIPMLLGISLIFPILFINNKLLWWGSTAFFAFSGALAYTNTLLKFRKFEYRHGDAFLGAIHNSRFTKLSVFHICMTSSITAVCAASFVLIYLENFPRSAELLCILIIISLMGGIILTSRYYYLAFVYKKLDMI